MLPFRFRRGLLANLPILNEGEPAITNDTGTERMYFGSSSGNKRVALYSDLETSLVASNVAFTPVGSLAAQDVQDAIAEVDANETSTRDTLDIHTDDFANPHQVTKTQVGLGNADNTSDLDKPVSTATQSALDLKQGIANSFATIITTQFYTATSYNAAARWVSPFNQTTAYVSYAALVAASPIFRVPFAGKLKYFWITGTANSWNVGASAVYTVYVNSSPTALTVTISTGVLSAYDTANEVSVIAGDIITFHRAAVSGGTSGTFGDETFAVMFQKTV